MNTFATRYALLLEDHEGMYAVIYRAEMLDVFYCILDAWRQGRKEWGNEPFLIKRIWSGVNPTAYAEARTISYGGRQVSILVDRHDGMIKVLAREGKTTAMGDDEEMAIAAAMEKVDVREWLEAD